jgi:hypothetical protein
MAWAVEKEPGDLTGYGWQDDIAMEYIIEFIGIIEVPRELLMLIVPLLT